LAEVFEFTALERPPFLVEDSASAEERAVAVQAEAQHNGYQEGLERGMAEAHARVERALEAVAAAELALAELHDRYVAEAEAAAVDLAYQIAEKVIGATVASDRQAVLGVVSGALLRTTDRDHLVLEVNPDDFDLVRESATELAARLGGINRIEVISERRVEPGGCVVRTEAGEIDARVTSQLERVRQLLAEAGGAAPVAAEPRGA
jgi:flagellar assembly protein FliH